MRERVDEHKQFSEERRGLLVGLLWPNKLNRVGTDDCSSSMGMGMGMGMSRSIASNQVLSSTFLVPREYSLTLDWGLSKMSCPCIRHILDTPLFSERSRTESHSREYEPESESVIDPDHGYHYACTTTHPTFYPMLMLMLMLPLLRRAAEERRWSPAESFGPPGFR